MQRDGETPDAEVREDAFRDGVSAGPARSAAESTGEPEEEPEVQIPPAGSMPPPPSRSEGFFRMPKQDGPVLITEAAPSLDQQHRDRVRRYMVLMGFRIPCLVLAAGAYGLWHNALISLVIIGVSVPLPWIAVLVANDRPPRRKDEPSRWDARRAEHKALESGRTLESGRNRSIDS
jgi:hypothetical protein